MSRITLTNVMTGPIAGLKTVVKEFLAANDVGCILQTTMIESSRCTVLVMEGEKNTLIETRDLLVLKLNCSFVGIKYDVWKQEDSEEPWPNQTIKLTPDSVTRNSSGYFDEEIRQTITTDRTISDKIIKATNALNGYIIKTVNQATPLIVRAVQTAGELNQVYSSASSLKDGLVKNAPFSYQGNTVLLNTQPWLDWTLLIAGVRKAFHIPTDSSFNIYKKLDEGALCQILEISGIEATERYYVQTDADAMKKGILWSKCSEIQPNGTLL
jgi:hypothetical protein